MITRSSKHQANIEQTSSKYEACIKHSLHEANIKQSSSKTRANIEQLEHTSCTCILNAFAGCLLDDCSMFAWSCKRGITLPNQLSALCLPFCVQDTLRDDCDNSDDCVYNCCVSPVVAPVFFVVFVLMAQFVLVNVVVAVLMKHLEVSPSSDQLRTIHFCSHRFTHQMTNVQKEGSRSSVKAQL